MVDGTKILVGDDDATCRELCQRVLTSKGYEVIEAEDGETVLALARSEEPGLILLDIILPDLTGFSVCERLRQDPRTQNIAIVMITGADSLDTEIQGLRAGADEYLAKPFSDEALLEAVRTTLPGADDTLSARILVVDDSNVNLQVMEGYLHETGYEVDLVDNGIDALTLAQANPPDVVLLDVQMPGMDGYEVCAALKRDARTQAIPVMFVTANALGDDEMLKGYDIGAVDYLRKPFLRDELLARLQVMVRIKRQQTDLERQVFTDVLTGLPNRRQFLTRLREEFSRSRRHELELTALLLDIDHFKNVNDTYGHDAGDHVLREVGALIGALVRTEDVAARYGGEEFTFLLPETALDPGLLLAQRIRRSIAALEIDYEGTVIPVTVSIGAANFPMLPIQNPKELIRYADEALYRAKEGGRNQVQAFRTATA